MSISLKIDLQNLVNNKTKPIGSLGMLEDLAIQLGLIQHTTAPQIIQPQIIIFAGDHGIATTGLVNPFPQAVTAQMVYNFVNGGAAINVFSKQNNIELTVVDCGVNEDFPTDLPILHYKVNKATKNYLHENAMSLDEVNICINNGKKITELIVLNKKTNCIGFGEMGISNTSSAALIMHYYLKLPIESCVGIGTGTNNEQLITKINTLQQVANFHQLHHSSNPNDLLCKIGGFEIATMVGSYLKAFEKNLTIVVDGFITTAALLVALNIEPKLINNCIFAHCSNEQGHLKMLNHLNATPILNLGLRLGEGTGAALAIPILESACAFINKMASFESAGVSNKD
ncbi:MAG: nicotinate-nucleotide--dimethylbenzimidazole phosphoribosyltransferase [Chitinophagaceae bacterium]